MATSANVSGVRIDTEGAVSAVTAEGGDTLGMLQAGVGGYVDVVRLPEGIDMWVGDEAAYTQPAVMAAPTVCVCWRLGTVPSTLGHRCSTGFWTVSR